MARQIKKIEDFWNKNEWILWLDKATDNWEIERKDGEIFIFLVTMRGRKTLGKKVFVFDDSTRFSDAEIFERNLVRILPISRAFRDSSSG